MFKVYGNGELKGSFKTYLQAFWCLYFAGITDNVRKQELSTYMVLTNILSISWEQAMEEAKILGWLNPDHKVSPVTFIGDSTCEKRGWKTIQQTTIKWYNSKGSYCISKMPTSTLKFKVNKNAPIITYNDKENILIFQNDDQKNRVIKQLGL